MSQTLWCPSCPFETTNQAEYEFHFFGATHGSKYTKGRAARYDFETSKHAFKCRPCGFYTNEERYWTMHLATKEHGKRAHVKVHVCPVPTCTKWATSASDIQTHAETCDLARDEDVDDLPTLPLAPTHHATQEQKERAEAAMHRDYHIDPILRQDVPDTLKPPIEPTGGSTVIALQIHHVVLPFPEGTSGKEISAYVREHWPQGLGHCIRPDPIERALVEYDKTRMPAIIGNHIYVYRKPVHVRYKTVELKRAIRKTAYAYTHPL